MLDRERQRKIGDEFLDKAKDWVGENEEQLTKELNLFLPVIASYLTEIVASNPHLMIVLRHLIVIASHSYFIGRYAGTLTPDQMPPDFTEGDEDLPKAFDEFKDFT